MDLSHVLRFPIRWVAREIEWMYVFSPEDDAG